MGESLAGLFVVETFFLEPELFDTYIAIDPSLWWNNQKLVEDSAARLREYLTRAGDRDVTIETYPNVGHQLIVSKSGYNGDRTLPERFVPGYPQIMITWLAQRGFTNAPGNLGSRL